MQTFTDTQGKSWSIVITVDAIKRVKALTGIDLLQTVNGTLFEKLAGDPVTLCDVLYALCKPQADQCNVSDVVFGQSMAGDVIEQATNAFLEELVSFFPHRRRTLLSKALAKLKTVEDRVLSAVADRLESPELDRQLEKAMEEFRTSGEPFTPSPQSSASIPVP